MNNSLQKKYGQLVKQLTGKGNISVADAGNKNRNSSPDNKIEELNIELRLAQVDCNLTRADAGQIISKSKQRRQLLSEALCILTNLSAADNAIAQKKIRDKITRLNQVAKNYRDLKLNGAISKQPLKKYLIAENKITSD